MPKAAGSGQETTGVGLSGAVSGFEEFRTYKVCVCCGMFSTRQSCNRICIVRAEPLSCVGMLCAPRAGALTYEWVETGPGYCRDIYGENPWQYSVSCVGKTKCKNQCTALNCVGYAWSKTPELDYDGCQTQKKARCVMYTGLGEVSLFASPPTIYTCYARRPQATGRVQTALGAPTTYWFSTAHMVLRREWGKEVPSTAL